MRILAGIHPVREALSAGRPVERVLVARGASGARLQEIIDLCRERGIPVRFETRAVLDRLAGETPHQGIVAVGAVERYADAEEVFASARLVVVLDGVEDPHNLGAIVRTAHAAGADAVVIGQRRAAGLSEAAAKAAAGALAWVPVVRVVNIAQALYRLKQCHYQIYGLDERGRDLYDQVELREPAALVLGSEGKGLHQHVKKRCDFLVRIPLAGRIASLNVSVAAGVMLFEWRRRRYLAAGASAECQAG